MDNLTPEQSAGILFAVIFALVIWHYIIASATKSGAIKKLLEDNNRLLQELINKDKKKEDPGTESSSPGN